MKNQEIKSFSNAFENVFGKTKQISDDQRIDLLKQTELEQIDRTILDINYKCEQLGLPICGNLRSTRKSDVIIRMECLTALVSEIEVLCHRDQISKRKL
jgi:hypothetical protein